MIRQKTFDFLNELQANNTREWFAEHKKEFDQEFQNAKAFFQQIGSELGKQDSIEKVHVFRIYRDVRFSKDKAPYKTHFSVSFSRTKPLLRGGMYLHIENNNSFIAGGFWEPNVEDLQRIRKEIELDAEELRSILQQPQIVETFGTLTGDELKTAPKGFDKNHPDIDLIRKKQYLLVRKFTNKQVLQADFPQEILKTFAAMRPFFDYMSNVLTTNLNGESLY